MKDKATMSEKTKTRFSQFLTTTVTDRQLLAGGLLIVPAFLLLENPLVKTAHLLLFALLLLLCGKSIRVLPSVIIFASVVLINLVRPYGELLFSFLGLRITRGALELGINKAATLLGLILLSRFFVRSTIKLPGKIGSLLGKTFLYFEQITERWKTVEGHSLFERLDSLLVSISDHRHIPREGPKSSPSAPSSQPSETPPQEAEGTQSTGASVSGSSRFVGFLFLSGLVVLHWLSFAVDHVR